MIAYHVCICAFCVCTRLPTCADQRAVVVQRSQMGAGQREESVQPCQVATEAWPCQHRADDNVAQGVSDKAVREKILIS